ncbi:hypothetical protein GCM10025871_04570 [Deinococcus metallilatus]|nr:hypothetical protein GCM10025871_04570 [Deinococcus metallilatus]
MGRAEGGHHQPASVREGGGGKSGEEFSLRLPDTRPIAPCTFTNAQGESGPMLEEFSPEKKAAPREHGYVGGKVPSLG